MRRATACAALALLGWALPATAAGRPQVHALTGARIVVAPGQVIETGTIVLRDGIIEAVGAEVEPPADATLWELDERTVYAGLIEPYAVAARPDAEAEGRPQAGHANPLVRPESDATGWAWQAESVRGLREAGFTTAVVAPAAGLFRGRGVLLNLGDGEPGDNLLRRGVAQFASLGETAGDAYPRSKMGSVALFRQTLLDAGWYQRARQAYERRPAQERPPANTALETLAAVAAGDEPLVIETGDVLGSLRAIDLAAELGLDAWLVGNGEEYQWLEPIAAAGLPHLLPLDLPEKPAADEEDDLAVGLAELRHWDEAPDNPRRLLETGIEIAFTSHGLAEPKKLHSLLARALERGLTDAQALAALTTTPAELLGIAGRAGTIAAGKMANLVVTDRELFREETRIREVWIDGRRYEIKESKPPEIEPAGSWQLTVETGDGQQMAALLELSGEVSSLSGSVTVEGAAIALDSVEVSGSSVEISFDGSALGMPGTIRFGLEITGDEAAGSGTAPAGPFTISGRRAAAPGRAG